ncbi:VTT domain-containing protein [Sphingomonas sp. BT-65]|uniref:TVP38/TMEM64 family protein n=1 Tax=Sphingomonas sp. BT-65 TaxID=2989821 RepID=UPI0022361FDC|nr:VTT domain-containing protein [Sphingomonas sp. BT-65]MCW4462607.1 VTT domain-containing protein [Sphingomonas sp. BT-65]
MRGIDRLGRLWLLLAIIMVAGGLAGFAAGWLSIDAVQRLNGALDAASAAHPLAALALAFLVILVLTALCFPVAPLIGVAAGSLFGPVTGFVLTLAASVAGSTIAQLAARHMLREAVRARLAPLLARHEAGIARHGAAYLFALRLLPFVPYWSANLLAGLSGMRLRAFVPVTAIGLAPSILFYTLAGDRLAHLSSLDDLGSPALLGALLLFGLAPLLGIAGARVARQMSSTIRR